MGSGGALLGALSGALDKRRETGRLIVIPDPKAQEKAIDFGSNDILSISSGLLRGKLLLELKNHPKFSVGSKGSRILDGTSQYLVDLEAHTARFHNAKDSLFFNSGYDANVAIWTTLPQPGDVILHDGLIHASTHDGMKYTWAKKTIFFQHNNTASFEKVLKSIKNEYREIARGTRSLFIALESVYSMDGDICVVRHLLTTAKEILPDANRFFVINEAHSNGILGPRGSGLVCHYGLEDEFTIRLHTFGKAMAPSWQRAGRKLSFWQTEMSLIGKMQLRFPCGKKWPVLVPPKGERDYKM